MKIKDCFIMSIICLLPFGGLRGAALVQKGGEAKSPEQIGVRIIRNIVIYEDPVFYSAFPSVVRTGENDFLLAFRRCPDRSVVFGEKGNPHTDKNSYVMALRSTDGENWSENPELVCAHPFGGSQDPCLLRLRDGTLICSSYGWASLMDTAGLKKPCHILADNFVALGGYLMRSFDDGKSWQGPIYPPHIEAEILNDALGNPLPAYNRGAMCEEENGRIYWVVVAHETMNPIRTSNHLLVSDDKGTTWQYSGKVAGDENSSFDEVSIYQTPKGDLVAFIRSYKMDDQAHISRSTDGGKTFTWEKMGFQGHPFHALRLPDDRVLLVYGYRHEPYGIRARILNEECADFASAPEIILRDDGGDGDLGYPWSVMIDGNRVLVAYYFNKEGGVKHIAGTILEIDNLE